MSPVDSLHSFDSPPPTDISNAVRIPRQQPSPVSFFAPEKMSQYDAHLRRASLDAQTVQRPYQSREWLTPRVLEEYQHNLLPPFAIPTKPEPEYSQWGLMRPSHPSPEANPGFFHRQVSAPDSERPVYSWAPSVGNREFFSPSTTPPSSAQEQFSPPTSFWHVNEVPGSRGSFEQVNAQRPGWAGRAIYGPAQ